MTTNSLDFLTIPQVNEDFIPWGNYHTIQKIVESEQFFPVWITGETGSGKTTLVEQMCANLKRKLVRVNFTKETDESDLIGRIGLVDGATVFKEGPVVTALRAGAILLLDEVDAADSNRGALALQSVLEGKGVMIKATGEFVKPAKGFNVIATANTQGRGSDSGKYIGTNLMNGAFLDRFGVMLHEKYPPKEIEKKLLQNYLGTFIEHTPVMRALFSKMTQAQQAKFLRDDMTAWIDTLTTWADGIRSNYFDGTVEDVISTRTLINIVQSFAIFNDDAMAVKMACDRFPTDSAESFYSIYTKLQGAQVPEKNSKPKTEKSVNEDIVEIN